MKEVIMQVQSFSADYPKGLIYVSDLVRCEDCQFYTGDREYCENDHFCRPDDFCSKGIHRKDNGNG